MRIYILDGTVKRVDTAPWSHCANRNVFSERLNWPYDSHGCLGSGGKRFHTLRDTFITFVAGATLVVCLWRVQLFDELLDGLALGSSKYGADFVSAEDVCC